METKKFDELFERIKSDVENGVFKNDLYLVRAKEILTAYGVKVLEEFTKILSAKIDED